MRGDAACPMCRQICIKLRRSIAKESHTVRLEKS